MVTVVPETKYNCTRNSKPQSHIDTWRYSSTILNLGSKWRWTASCPSHLTHHYPMNTRLVPQDLWQVRFTTCPT